MKVLVAAGSIVVVLGMALVTALPSCAEPASPVQGLGPAPVPSIEAVNWRGRGAWRVGRPAFRSGGPGYYAPEYYGRGYYAPGYAQGYYAPGHYPPHYESPAAGR